MKELILFPHLFTFSLYLSTFSALLFPQEHPITNVRNHFLEEINQGEGWKFPSGIKGYMSYGLPLLIIIIYLKGYYDKFQPMGTKVLVGWMIVAILFLTFVIGCSCGNGSIPSHSSLYRTIHIPDFQVEAGYSIR